MYICIKIAKLSCIFFVGQFFIKKWNSKYCNLLQTVRSNVICVWVYICKKNTKNWVASFLGSMFLKEMKFKIVQFNKSQFLINCLFAKKQKTKTFLRVYWFQITSLWDSFLLQKLTFLWSHWFQMTSLSDSFFCFSKNEFLMSFLCYKKWSSYESESSFLLKLP